MLLEEGEGEDEEIFQSINKVISRINKNHFLKHFYIILCDQKKKLNEREFLNFKREYIGRPLSITFLIFNKIYLQRFLPNQKRSRLSLAQLHMRRALLQMSLFNKYLEK